jgi:hypothetical protein
MLIASGSSCVVLRSMCVIRQPQAMSAGPRASTSSSCKVDSAVGALLESYGVETDAARIAYYRVALGPRQLKRFVKQAALEDYRSEGFGETLGAWPHELRVRRIGRVRSGGSPSRGAM